MKNHVHTTAPLNNKMYIGKNIYIFLVQNKNSPTFLQFPQKSRVCALTITYSVTNSMIFCLNIFER